MRIAWGDKTRTCTVLGAVAVALSAFSGAGALVGPDTGSGCMVIGNGPGVLEARCHYVASGTPNTVVAVTRDRWDITVVRTTSTGPETIVLLEGVGPTVPPFPVVEPLAGEEVTVCLGDNGSCTAGNGFVSVGQDEALIPGGLPSM